MPEGEMVGLVALEMDPDGSHELRALHLSMPHGTYQEKSSVKMRYFGRFQSRVAVTLQNGWSGRCLAPRSRVAEPNKRVAIELRVRQ